MQMFVNSNVKYRQFFECSILVPFTHPTFFADFGFLAAGLWAIDTPFQPGWAIETHVLPGN